MRRHEREEIEKVAEAIFIREVTNTYPEGYENWQAENFATYSFEYAEKFISVRNEWRKKNETNG